MTKPIRRPRALRPLTESLETRNLLSKFLTGQDVDGDTWALVLIGPGDLRVVNQNGPDGNPVPLGHPGLINTIEIAGGDPHVTRLVGKVTKGPGGDGKVFFQKMAEIGGRSERLASGNGIESIDIPGFWLGFTNPTSGATPGTPAASITIPDGVITLRFGGADTTAFFGNNNSNRLDQNNQNDQFTVNLGLPQTTGSSIIVDKVITSAQAGQASPTGGPGTPTQDSVTFTATGRLNLFQANEIDGSTAFPATGFNGGGGTIVNSSPDVVNQITGQIGTVRIGGNATDFAAQTNDKVNTFFVGGETNHVFLLAPAGSRDLLFGKGMDNVTIHTHTISTLQANRGALNSDVTVDRSAGKVIIGGDAVNTNILSGYQQSLGTEFQQQQPPTTPPNAQDGGAMTVLVAGDVMDSVFAASVEPSNGIFGTPQDLKLPSGTIQAKLEGKIDNSTATPDSPTTAFYAKHVKLVQGPVFPPSVVEPPFHGTVFHMGQLGLSAPNPLNHPAKSTGTKTTSTGVTKAAIAQAMATHSVHTAAIHHAQAVKRTKWA